MQKSQEKSTTLATATEILQDCIKQDDDYYGKCDIFFTSIELSAMNSDALTLIRCTVRRGFSGNIKTSIIAETLYTTVSFELPRAILTTTDETEK